ncbi:hypothetical protein KIH27_20500 [Mycobacterium sp. M1]|uniref:Uncharacterized protein n=1 Tax=Mycolicibacter acidiphilus TaxID=2835306 RepID=A0ABS5RNT6_9MYCO|nr:hypothetical protein [Mycolicibacter acidiphilus]MBS9535968.1 hypothetical protein [Mycolicibacter acidiphilus]
MTPRGDIVATAGRGAWMGNRGRLHEGRGTRDVVRRWQSKAWITCRLEFRGWRAAQWEPNHYTPLFFLDEAVAFAAGHRPCAECRRADYNAYRAAWAESLGGAPPYAKEMDTRLHAERTGDRPHLMPWATLPDGVFVDTDHGPAVLAGDHLAVFDERSYGYRPRLARPTAGDAPVWTPPANVAVLRAGYPVQTDPAAR